MKKVYTIKSSSPLYSGDKKHQQVNKTVCFLHFQKNKKKLILSILWIVSSETRLWCPPQLRIGGSVQKINNSDKCKLAHVSVTNFAFLIYADELNESTFLQLHPIRAEMGGQPWE